MPQEERFDLREFLVDGCSGRNGLRVDFLARLLDCVECAVQTRLDVELAGSRDKKSDETAIHEAYDALAHLVARQIQILADIRETRIGAATGGIGVVCKYWDSCVERFLDRRVERLGIDD